MRLALEEAVTARDEGNDPVGSVIVHDGEIVAVGRNQIYTTYDATSHAETDAIRNAGAAQQDPDLSGSTIYTTFEPCPMCCGAILNAGITTIVLGGRPVAGEWRFGPYSIDWLIEQLGWSDRMNVISGVLPQECYDIARTNRRGDRRTRHPENHRRRRRPCVVHCHPEPRRSEASRLQGPMNHRCHRAPSVDKAV